MAWIHENMLLFRFSKATVQCVICSHPIPGGISLVEVMHEIAQSLQLSQHVALWIFLVASKPVLQFISTLVLWGIYLTLLLASSMEYYGQYVKQIIVTVLIATLVNETAHTSTC